MAAPHNPELPPAGSLASAAGPLFQPAAPSLAELQQSVSQLRRMFQVATAALALFLLALNVFLFNQLRIVRKQAADWNQQVQEMQRAMDEYRSNSVPYLSRVSTELRRYADTHPDFAAVMARYPKPTGALPAVAKQPASLAPVPPRAGAPPPKNR